MKKLRIFLIFILISLLIISIFIPLSFGNNLNYNSKVISKDDYQQINKFDVYTVSELMECNLFSNELPTQVLTTTEQEKSFSPKISDGPMDSPWLMYCHDARHTGRSTYSTVNNPGTEKWNFKCNDYVKSSPVIDSDNNIYFSAWDDYIYSLYPNSTIRWKHDIGQRWTESALAIDENGIVYMGTSWSPSGGDRLFAIYSNNGTRKWAYHTDGQVHSSPAISNNGTIFFSTGGGYPWYGYIYAISPNGALLWRYKTGHVIYSSPAIGLDGTVYCGSHDNYVYALYPNNGTLRWKFNTGNWVHCSPTIGDDGAVYIGSDNGHFYALYPNNGTVKWQCNIGGTWTSPAIDDDGILYVGVFEQYFYAIYPNGTIKWTYHAPGRIWFGNSAAISADGTIYFGTSSMDGGAGAFIALNSDGTERWKITNHGLFESSPAIGEDGTIYVCSTYDWYGFLRAFGSLDPDAPSAPEIDGPAFGRQGEQYWYYFKSTSPLNRDVYYYVDWGDGTITDWHGPYNSGDEVPIKHTWQKMGTYTIRARAKDTDNLWGSWGTLDVTMPLNQQSSVNLYSKSSVLFQFLQQLMNIHQ